MNNFYDKLLNIKGNNIEDEIQKAILETKHYYNELTTERTCFIYSSKIFEILKKNGVSCHLIDTSDFDIHYSHAFVLVPFKKDKFYLVDPTYEQFIVNKDVAIQELYNFGYIELNDEIWKLYLKDICSYSKDISVNDVFYGKKK